MKLPLASVFSFCCYCECMGLILSFHILFALEIKKSALYIVFILIFLMKSWICCSDSNLLLDVFVFLQCTLIVKYLILIANSNCRLASYTEWKMLYILCKDENGLLHKDAVRGVYDGSLFERMAKMRELQLSNKKSAWSLIYVVTLESSNVRLLHIGFLWLISISYTLVYLN